MKIRITRTTTHLDYVNDLFNNRFYYSVLADDEFCKDDYPLYTPYEKYQLENITCQLIKRDDRYYIYTMAKGKPEEVGYVKVSDLPYYKQFGKIQTRYGKMFQVIEKNGRLKVEHLQFVPYVLDLILEEK